MGNLRKRFMRVASILLGLQVSIGFVGGETFKLDVVVYGGTSAAISAAGQVKKMGKSVVVVSPDAHLGGLSSSGLGWTDSGRKEAIGGIASDCEGS